MSDSSPLVVPIEVEALVVNDDVRGDAFQRWTYSYVELGLFASAEPAPFGPVDTDFTAPPGKIVRGDVTTSEYYNGVYLKWRVPDALRHGVQENVNGTTHFPHVPNRWFVVRGGTTAWLVESDYRRPAATPTSYIDTGSDFIDPEGHPMTIGRTIPLTADGWSEPGNPAYLTAVAPGNLGFSAYQPACNNVFSFVDRLGGATGPFEYLVLGWHSDLADDPLHGVDAEHFTGAMTDLGWQLPLGTDPQATASSVVYSGTVTGVADPSSVTAGGAPAKTDVSVAIAPSTARALTTLVAQQADADNAAVDAELLEALVLDLVRAYDQADGPAQVDEAAFASGFRVKTGGSSWVLVPASAQGDPPPAPLTPNQLAALAEVNQAQAAADAADRALADLRRRLYELWFKYELLPAPGTNLTQAELKPGLDPTISTSLAGQVVAAEADADAKAAAVATLTATGKAPPGYAFKQENRPPFCQPADPVVLLSKAGAPAIAAPGTKLTCRLPTQLVSGYTESGGQIVTASSPGVSIPQPATGPLTGVPWSSALLGTLVAEDYFLDTLPSGAVPTGTVPPAEGRRAWTAQPWHPLYLMWQGNYYAIEHDTGGRANWTFADGSYGWNGEGAAPTEHPVQLQGRILLTPQANLTVGARLQTLLDTTPDLDPTERQALETLQSYVQSKDDWDLLSQALDGFTDQLLKRMTGAFPSPAQADLITTPSQADLIDGGAGNPPRPADDGTFQPWRSGQFEFLGLALVDEWGQTVFVADRNDFQHLVLARPYEMLPKPASVLAPEPDPMVQLSPALLQPGRLDFDLVSPDGTQVLGLDPGVNPICGWVVPNHLDQALMAFDASGAAIGELGVGIGADQEPAVVWRPAPGTQYTTWPAITAIPQFGPFLQLLHSGTADELAATLAAIDETLWTTTPVGTAFDRNLATLAGRPLAMVRARLAFELEGESIADPSWEYTQAPAPTPAPTWSYAIELGNLEKLSDGLIGYLTGNEQTVYVVAQSGAAAGGYLKLIGSGDGLIDLTFDGTTSALVSMLVDPRAAVHATTGILPVSSVSLPPGVVIDALARIDLSFRVGPFLAGERTTPSGSALLIPQPSGEGTWAWIDASSSTGATTPIAPPGTQASLTDAPPVLRSGRLDLKSAFDSPDQSTKGPDR
jgi:hypothetical protein